MIKWAMSKIRKIKEFAAHGKGLNSSSVSYLLWYYQSLENENKARTGLGYLDDKEGYVRENYPNWIGHKRAEVDKGLITIEEYEKWYKLASENNKKELAARKNSESS